MFWNGQRGLWDSLGESENGTKMGLNTFHSPEKPKQGLTAKIKAQVGRKILSLFSC